MEEQKGLVDNLNKIREEKTEKDKILQTENA